MTRLLLILAVAIILFALWWPHHYAEPIRKMDDVVITNQRLTDECWRSLAAVEAVIEGQRRVMAALVDCEKERR